MRKIMCFLAVLGIVSLVWAADPYIGTWKLNPTKTKVTGSVSADASATSTISGQEYGMKLTYNGVDAAGKPTHLEFDAKYDGKDYSIKGNPAIDTVSIRRINNNTQERLYKKGGKEAWSQHAVVSEDGRTGTVHRKEKTRRDRPLLLLQSGRSNSTVVDVTNVVGVNDVGDILNRRGPKGSSTGAPLWVWAGVSQRRGFIVRAAEYRSTMITLVST